MSEYAIEMEGITKEFTGVRALQDVSFRIKKGSVHAIVGENGAGKSTLINIISGALAFTAGEMKVFGRQVRFKSPADAKKAGITSIYQELNVAPDLDVKSNIFLGSELVRGAGLLDRRRMKQHTRELLERLDIDIDPDRIMSTLSVAQTKMIEIARAIYNQSSIIIMDEPTASISDHEVAILHRFIGELREKNHTILYISHKQDEIFQICDAITVLRDGRHIMTKPICEMDRAGLASAMINKKDFSEQFPKRMGTPGKEPVLEVDALSCKGVFQDISFQLHRGEILGIAGMVGARRTEMVKALIGEHRRDSGTLQLYGKPVNIRHAQDALRYGIAYLPEDRKREGLFLDQSFAMNNVISSLDAVSDGIFVNRKKILEEYRRSKEMLSIAIASPNQRMLTLSGGNQQKGIIAKWLKTSCNIFIFDEPTVGIDIGAKYEIQVLINGLADAGKSVILISSELGEVCNLSDRLLVMRDGRIVRTLPKENISKEVVYNYAAGVQ